MQRERHFWRIRLARGGTSPLLPTFLVLAATGAWGCGGGGAAAVTDPTTPTQPPEAAAALASLGLTPADAEIPVGGQVRIVVTALDAAGNPLSGLPAPAFTSNDPAIARVEGDGLVVGVAGGRAVITASLTAGGITRSAAGNVTVNNPPAPPPAAPPSHAVVSTPDRSFNPRTVTIAAGGTVTWQMTEDRHDVTFVGAAPPDGSIPESPRGSSVSRAFPTPGRYEYECSRHRDRGMRGTIIVAAADAPAFTTLSLTPSAPTVAVGATLQLTATPLDQNGSPIPGLPAASFSSSDPARATVDAAGRVTGVAEGSATITASLNAGGVTREATARVTVATGGGAPGSATVNTPGASFDPRTVTIAAGGTVTWQFSGARHNVVFRGAAPPGGNIPDTDAGSAVTRTFPTAGSYDYDCTRHSGMTGRVVVQ